LPALELSENEKMVYDSLDHEELSTDEVIRKCGPAQLGGFGGVVQPGDEARGETTAGKNVWCGTVEKYSEQIQIE